MTERPEVECSTLRPLNFNASPVCLVRRSAFRAPPFFYCVSFTAFTSAGFVKSESGTGRLNSTES